MKEPLAPVPFPVTRPLYMGFCLDAHLTSKCHVKVWPARPLLASSGSVLQGHSCFTHSSFNPQQCSQWVPGVTQPGNGGQEVTDYIATLLCATSWAPPTCPVSRWHQPQLPRALLAGAKLGMQGRGRRWRGSRVWAWDSREGAGRGLRAGKVKAGVTSSPGSRISLQVEQGQRGSGRAPRSGLRSGWQTGGCGDEAAPGVTGQATTLGKGGAQEWRR